MKIGTSTNKERQFSIFLKQKRPEKVAPWMIL